MMAPAGVGLNHGAPTLAAERSPQTFGLSKPVCHCERNSRMCAHSTVTGVHFDTLRDGRRILHTALPRANTIAPAENGCGRNRRRFGEITAELALSVADRFPAGHFIDAPCIGG